MVDCEGSVGKPAADLVDEPSGRDTPAPREDDLVILRYRGKLGGSKKNFVSRGWGTEDAPVRSVLKELGPEGLMEGLKSMMAGAKATIALTSE